jgi:hypothetical protein
MNCDDTTRPLTFETMVNDPLVHLVMAADGVSLQELVSVLQAARASKVAHQRVALLPPWQAPRFGRLPA